jgi:hypothetical protein
MSKKHIVTTSRGLKLDFDALKKSQSSVKRLVTGVGKEKPAPKGTPKTILVTNSKPRIKATVPAHSPKESHFLPINVVPPVQENTDVPSPVVEAGLSIVEKVEEAEKEIKEFEKANKKDSKRG